MRLWFIISEILTCKSASNKFRIKQDHIAGGTSIGDCVKTPGRRLITFLAWYWMRIKTGLVLDIMQNARSKYPHTEKSNLPSKHCTLPPMCNQLQCKTDLPSETMSHHMINIYLCLQVKWKKDNLLLMHLRYYSYLSPSEMRRKKEGRAAAARRVEYEHSESHTTGCQLQTGQPSFLSPYVEVALYEYGKTGQIFIFSSLCLQRESCSRSFMFPWSLPWLPL